LDMELLKYNFSIIPLYLFSCNNKNQTLLVFTYKEYFVP